MSTQYQYLIILIWKTTNDPTVAKRGTLLKSQLMGVNGSLGMWCEVIVQNIHFIDFRGEAVLEECRVEGLDTLFCLTVMDYQGNIHLFKDDATYIRLEFHNKYGGPIKHKKKSTLDAPCEIIWTLTPFLRRTLNACHAGAVDINHKHRASSFIDKVDLELPFETACEFLLFSIAWSFLW